MTSIVFLEPSLSLINIPLRLFPHFTHSILQLIQYPPEFFNISLTPTSLSIICPEQTAARYFSPVLEDLKEHSGATIEDEDYVCMQIDGEGMGDGSRLLELTQPLARAGISILFITTYFSDYVLVASRQMKKVRKVLLDRGFSFADLSQSALSMGNSIRSRSTTGESVPSTRSSSPVGIDFDDEFDDIEDSIHNGSYDSVKSRDAHEKESNTLEFLRRGKIPVKVSRGTKLLMLGSRVQFSDYVIPLTKVFLRKELPEFFSITRAPETSPSFLITQDLAQEFDPQTLLGIDTAEVLIPIMLDLSGLTGVGGLGGCGIVCGVVDELMQRALKPSPASMEQMLSKEELVLSYLSTVVTGNVLVRQQDVERIGSAGDDCVVM